jgi:hypothetical protein
MLIVIRQPFILLFTFVYSYAGLGGLLREVEIIAEIDNTVSLTFPNSFQHPLVLPDIIL